MTIHYLTAKALNAAIVEARAVARASAAEGCPRGAIMSRGVHIYGDDARGDVVLWECEQAEFKSFTALLEDIANVEKNHPNVVELWVGGGFNYAESPRAYADGEYDPWVSSWDIKVWDRDN